MSQLRMGTGWFAVRMRSPPGRRNSAWPHRGQDALVSSATTIVRRPQLPQTTLGMVRYLTLWEVRMGLLLATVLAMQDVDELIRRLGHQEPSERDKAEKQLVELAQKLGASLKKGAASEDAEVRGRVERVRKALELALKPATKKPEEELKELDDEIRE